MPICLSVASSSPSNPNKSDRLGTYGVAYQASELESQFRSTSRPDQCCLDRQATGPEIGKQQASFDWCLEGPHLVAVPVGASASQKSAICSCRVNDQQDWREPLPFNGTTSEAEIDSSTRSRTGRDLRVPVWELFGVLSPTPAETGDRSTSSHAHKYGGPLHVLSRRVLIHHCAPIISTTSCS